ncbi:MAG TPA: putative LPS assembly protein LptD, partial [Bacteroidales bacterium]|nr:putative LPS assembly protein LptD [Bacteroidales bacterium]
STYDSLLFKPEGAQSMKNGFKHDAPLSIQLRPFKNFNISPSLTYSGVLYSRKMEKHWDEETGKVVKDTLEGMFYGQAVNPAISAGYNPQIFGMYTFLNPESRVQAVRHVIKPSVGFSYVPEVPGLTSGMYKKVQTNSSASAFEEYSVFEGNIYGTPSSPKRNGSLSFGLVNLVEAKVLAKDDTTGVPQKVKIIDNFGINTSYDIFAESKNWAPVSMTARTTLMENINISARGGFSLYSLDSTGNETDKFLYSTNRKLMRLTGFGASVDFSLDRLLMGKESGTAGGPQSTGPVSQRVGGNEEEGGHDQMESIKSDLYGYQAFEMPWTFNVSYSLNYSKPALKSTITQTLSFNGSVTITKKMLADFTSGYDFTTKTLTMTQIGIRRDLHCWIMNFNWVPNGTMKGWNFTIRAKASVLGDLKYERKKDFHDKY